MRTIRRIDARDAAVPSGVAPEQTVCRTIRIRDALDAFSTGAMCPHGALAEGTASRRATGRTGYLGSRVVPSENSAAGCLPPARQGRSACARAARLCVELETLIARGLERAEGNHDQ